MGASAVLLAAGVGAYVALRGSQSASAAVSQAIATSLGDRTADWTMVMTEHVGGQTATMSTKGASDFTTNQSTMTMQIDQAGRHELASGVYDGHTVFINAGNTLSQLLPGKSWVSMDLGQLSAGNGALPGGGGEDPSSLLHVLGAEGNEVTSLGPSRINGESVQGYAVHMTQTAVAKAIAQQHLPSWMEQGMALLQATDVTYDVYVNGASHLDRTSAIIDATLQGQHLVETLQQDFSNYGVPVHISDPPPDQVISFTQFMQEASQHLT